MDQREETLEQKQEYLRQSIDEDHYEEFFQFCTEVIGSVDINEWSMEQIKNIVLRFNQQKSMGLNHLNNNHPKYSYNDYQSKPYHEQSEYYEDSHVENSEISECQSSKIEKKSAVDLLDSVLVQNNYTSVKTQPRGLSSPGKKSTPNNAPSTQSNKNNAFNEFDFWTSTVSKPNNESENRAKSSSQYFKTSLQNNNMSPPTATKNTYHHSNFNYDSYSIKPQEQVRERNSTVVPRNTEFDIFDLGVQSNKTSPYMKKEQQEPYGASSKALIKLKEVKNVENNKHETIEGRNNGDYFESEVNCFKSMIRNQLENRDLRVFIDKHEIIERKLLAADYAMFNLNITPLKRECKRNYDDFVKLRDNLTKFFPGICLPYLEPSSWLHSTSPDYIANQKKMLEFFTRDLIRNKEIRNSRVMEDFLTLKDHKAIKRKFEKYGEMENLKGLEELCLVSGKLKVSLNPEQKNYNEQLEKFLQKMNNFFERQESLTEQMINQYNEMMRTNKFLISLTEEMEKEVKDFNSKVSINKIQHLGDSIRLIRETYKEDLSNMKFEHELNNAKILPFIKYEKKNFMELEKLIEVEKKMKRSFDKRSSWEKIGVGETYKSESTKESKKGILEESPSFLVFKHQVGYLGYQVCHEGQRIFDELAVKAVNRWQTLGDSYLDKLTANISYWENLKRIDITKFNTELTY